ncbi:MAG: hypothetical protein WCJ81_07525 [bacterium]
MKKFINPPGNEGSLRTIMGAMDVFYKKGWYLQPRSREYDWNIPMKFRFYGLGKTPKEFRERIVVFYLKVPPVISWYQKRKSITPKWGNFPIQFILNMDSQSYLFVKITSLLQKIPKVVDRSGIVSIKIHKPIWYNEAGNVVSSFSEAEGLYSLPWAEVHDGNLVFYDEAPNFPHDWHTAARSLMYDYVFLYAMGLVVAKRTRLSARRLKVVGLAEPITSADYYKLFSPLAKEATAFFSGVSTSNTKDPLFAEAFAASIMGFQMKESFPLVPVGVKEYMTNFIEAEKVKEN